MRLTVYTDYGLRLLIYVAVKQREIVTIQEVADAYGISKNHLMKVTHNLGRHGYLETVRGRHGGLKLARPPEEIGLGDVIRRMEDDFRLVECFEPTRDCCRITRVCRLKGILNEALKAYLAVFEKYTLADLTGQNPALAKMLLSA